MDTQPLIDRIIENTAFRRNVYRLVPRGAGRILDFGAGSGGLVLRLKRDRACTDLHALEINPEDVKILTPLLDGVWSADYEKGERLPPEYEGYFNHLILHDVVEHFADPWVTLSRLRDLLSAKGRMIVATPNILYWMLQHDILRGRFPYGPGLWHTGHLRWFTPASLFELLVVAGLEVETLYLEIPEKVSFLRAAQAGELRQVSFPPVELAARHPDRPPVSLTYAEDIKGFYPVFFASKLIAVCARGLARFPLQKVKDNCAVLAEMRDHLGLRQAAFAPCPMIPLMGDTGVFGQSEA